MEYTLNVLFKQKLGSHVDAANVRSTVVRVIMPV